MLLFDPCRWHATHAATACPFRMLPLSVPGRACPVHKQRCGHWQLATANHHAGHAGPESVTGTSHPMPVIAGARQSRCRTFTGPARGPLACNVTVKEIQVCYSASESAAAAAAAAAAGTPSRCQ